MIDHNKDNKYNIKKLNMRKVNYKKSKA